MTTKQRVIELEVALDASAEEVWQALTDSQGISSWFAPEVKANQGVGEGVTLSWGGDMAYTTKITGWDKNSLVEWTDPPWEEGGLPSVVSFQIKAQGDKTVLKLVHSGFGADAQWDEQFEGMRSGWTYFLFNLQHYLRYHKGTARQIINERLPVAGLRSEVFGKLLKALDDAADTVEIGQSLMLSGMDGEQWLAEVAVLVAGRALGLRVQDWNEGLLFIEIEPGQKDSSVGFWLSTYGVEAKQYGAWLKNLVGKV